MLEKIVIYVIGIMAALGSHCLMAQEIGLTYTAELQTDFRKKGKLVNLLRADFTQPLGRNVVIEAAAISVSETCEKSLIDDWEGFSNVEAENIPLALGVLGVRWQTGESSVFFGVRNVNEDYFTSPCTSLFTNSSCGIFPTLSANYSIANYPLASVGIDYKWEKNNWKVEASVYNGMGYRMFAGQENVFRFCPESDGVLGVASINYRKQGSDVYVGTALRSEGWKKEDWDAVLWGYIEQKVSVHWSALVQYSADPTTDMGCRSYVGCGLVAHYGRLEGGIFADYADYTTKHEWASELTCRIYCLKNLYIQPALHLVRNSRVCALAGLVRLEIEI